MATLIDHVQNSSRSRIHPQKFALWASFAGIIMMFSGLTSAYVVRQAAGNWLEFRIPDMFFYSTAVIILSSIALQGSYIAFKRGGAQWYRILMVIAFLLGMLFIILQYKGWESLAANGVTLTGNPAGSFMYVIPGIHVAHVLGGLAALSIALIHAFLLPFKATKKRLLRFEMTMQYWHFVGFLWIYLLVFFVLQQN